MSSRLYTTSLVAVQSAKKRDLHSTSRVLEIQVQSATASAAAIYNDVSE